MDVCECLSLYSNEACMDGPYLGMCASMYLLTSSLFRTSFKTGFKHCVGHCTIFNHTDIHTITYVLPSLPSSNWFRFVCT